MPHFLPSILFLELVPAEAGPTLRATGDLDISSKAALVQALPSVLSAPRTDAPHLDLTALDFLDSAGLETLVWAHRRLTEQSRRLHLQVTSKSQPGRVLKLGGFHKLMQIDFV